jgi:hypothetical protein
MTSTNGVGASTDAEQAQKLQNILTSRACDVFESCQTVVVPSDPNRIVLVPFLDDQEKKGIIIGEIDVRGSQYRGNISLRDTKNPQKALSQMSFLATVCPSLPDDQILPTLAMALRNRMLTTRAAHEARIQPKLDYGDTEVNTPPSTVQVRALVIN